MTRVTVKHQWTAALDAEIQRVYTRRQLGEMTRLARRHQIPLSTLSTRARRKLCLPRIRDKEIFHRQWSDLEKQLLSHYRRMSNEAIAQLLLRRCGVRRSLKAIETQRTRLGLTHQADGADSYSPELIASGLGINTHTVYRWIKRGWLDHFRSGDVRILIRPTALRHFLIHYTAHWESAKADKWFLVDILSGQSQPKRPDHD